MTAIPFWKLLIGQEFKEHPDSVVVYARVEGMRFNAVVVRPGRESYKHFEWDTIVYVEETYG